MTNLLIGLSAVLILLLFVLALVAAYFAQQGVNVYTFERYKPRHRKSRRERRQERQR